MIRSPPRGFCRRTRGGSTSHSPRPSKSPSRSLVAQSRKHVREDDGCGYDCAGDKENSRPPPVRMRAPAARRSVPWWRALGEWSWWFWLVATCQTSPTVHAFAETVTPVPWEVSPEDDEDDAEVDWWLDTSAAALAMPLMRRIAARPAPAPSPVCVVTDNVASAPSETPSRRCAGSKPVPTALQLSAHAMTIIYAGLVCNRMWDASFARGPDRRLGERRLATLHLGQPSTDGWNVVVGALELARVWAVRCTTTVAAVGTDPHRLDRNTRLRLAVCLSVSWKFQRAMMTGFQKRFVDDWVAGEPCHEGHTRELAHLGYGFLFVNEQSSFGGWSDENAAEIRRLYATMLELEVELLKEVAVFTLLAENAQVEAERRLGKMHDAGVLTAERSMAVRSVVPFFVRAAVAGAPGDEGLHADLMGAIDVDASAGALVCVGFYCVAAALGASRPWPSFSPAELGMALRLVEAALAKRDAVFLRQGCYGSADWSGHQYVREESLRLARTALRSAGARV